jgi:hypothetical protein
MSSKTEYEWVNGNMANQVLRKTIFVVEDDDEFKESTPVGFVMKSGPTSYTAWIATDKQNHTGNRMEFYDMDTAKAWVFAQVRMNDGTALLRSSCVC